jgi:hypothetical protein
LGDSSRRERRQRVEVSVDAYQPVILSAAKDLLSSLHVATGWDDYPDALKALSDR